MIFSIIVSKLIEGDHDKLDVNKLIFIINENFITVALTMK